MYVLPFKPEAIMKPMVLNTISDTLIEEYIQSRNDDTIYSKNIKTFYEKRKFEYVWITPNGLAPRVEMFLNLMRGAEIKNDFSGDSLYTIYNHIINNPLSHWCKRLACTKIN